MRNSQSSYRSSRSKSNIQWKWIALAIVAIFSVYWIFSSKDSSNSGNGEHLSVTLEKESVGSITTASGKKKQIDKEWKLYANNETLTITTWSSKLSNSGIVAYMDIGELSYSSSSGGSEEKLTLNRGRTWIESQSDFQIAMKNLQVKLVSWDVVLLEQLPIYSIVYVLKGEVPIVSWGRTYTLTSGKRIMISQSDLANTSNTLDSLSGPIDDAIKQNPFFIAHGGESLLSNIWKDATSSGANNAILTGSNSPILSWSIEQPNDKFIEITNPLDGSTVNTSTVTIEWKLLSKDIKKITFNDKEALISPVNQSFTLKDFPLSSETTDIVYKVLDAKWNIFVKSVLTIKTKSKNLWNDKLVPTTFGTGDKNYKIISPTENPYRTSEETVTVSGVIPKNTVSYITVNNYRLKKYVPWSGTWYYFAGIKNETMKEWFNLYDIQFYDANDTLVSSQVFTIIKESKWSISGEVAN